MIRHFVSTGFVVHNDAVLLHWHRKVQAWLPPGGHIEPNEDPVQSTLREVQEETGMDVAIAPTYPQLEIGNLAQVDAPFTVMIENVVDEKFGAHQHIDFIYFTVPVSDPPPPPDGWRWVSRSDLERAVPMISPGGTPAPPPEDVIKLGIAALDTVIKARP
ncbi:MAG: NUDIX domain-containing protein [Dehalococcoidia bacterium]